MLVRTCNVMKKGAQAAIRQFSVEGGSAGTMPPGSLFIGREKAEERMWIKKQEEMQLEEMKSKLKKEREATSSEDDSSKVSFLIQVHVLKI